MQKFVELLPIVFFLAFGIIYCFAGYRYFKTLLIVAGGFAGLALGILISTEIFHGSMPATLGLSLVGVMAGTMLFYFINKFAIFNLGFIGGVMIGPLLMELMRINPSSSAGTVVLLLFGLCCGFVAVHLEKYVMVFVTTVIGAFTVVIAVHLLRAGKYRFNFSDVQDAYTSAMTHTWLLVIALLVAGVVYQMGSGGGKKSEA
jgi:hypothetical protein